jgi:ribonucleotide monophosphatase NagD (HAD superfamily)
VNALRTSIGRDPIILGKPHKTMWDVLGKVHQLDPARSCMIGDRLDTDIAFAANCSLGFSLAVLSGVSTEEEILQHSNLLNDPNHKENEKAKLVPDYYANSLRDFEIFIRDT